MTYLLGKSKLPDWRDRYRRHLRSPHWRYLKARIVMFRGGRCEHCGHTRNLELHHKTYARLGDELYSDLELLCRKCHKKADRKRAFRNAG